ncbi:Centrosomal protein 290kDa [Carabus blaptoides fortunei]
MSQEILKYKDEQVDSLMTEFDEIARKQGTEEAKLIQNLENEIKSLRSSSESRLQTPDIVANDSQSEVSEVTDKHQILSEHLREKNKQISQLLSDIECVEKENISLKENVIHLRDKLNEATEHIKQMTSEISGQKRVLHENRDKLDKLHEENTALRNQIEDLVNQKNERDVQLDHFSMTLDAKVEELKQVLSEKQTDIKELKCRNIELEKKISEHENTNKIPLEILLEREEQIVKLQAKLMEATQEIKKTTNVLNKMTTTKKPCTSNDEQDIIIVDLKLQLADSHARCQELQQQLDCTERDAQNYSEQFAELISRLHKYEEGQYGLSDALREMQDCRLQINIRDKQIAELIQNCNKLQSICDEVEHENLTHREKLGLPLDAPISKNGIISKQRKLKKLIRNLQNQIEVLEDEKLQMKVDLQKYKRSTELETDTKMQLGDEADLASEQNYKKQFTEMAEENEALRKGMHEILESIRAKNESGNREIKSQTLEQLLQIMDVRHVSGWYHPAMRLQAELNTLQGTNAELRNQLQITRSEINISNEESRKGETKIQELQQKIQDLSKSNKNITSIDSSFITSLVVPPNITATSAEIISKLNSHLLIVLNEYNNEVQNTSNLKENTCEKIIEWYKEKNTLQLNELKCRRNLEINELQLDQSLQRLRKQDVQLAHLEEELLKTSNSSLNNTFFTNLLRNSNSVIQKSIDKEIESKETRNTGTDPHCVEPVVLKSSVESQTDRIPPPINNKSEEIIASLQEQIRQANEIISLKDSNLQRQQMSIEELEQSVEILKVKLQESDNRVLVTENIVREPRQQVNVIDEIDLEEHNTLKCMVSKLQVIITQKEDTIAKYEQLLKQGRDEHSLAASRLQEEIKQLQILLQQQQQAYQDLKHVNTEPSSTDLIPNRTAIEQYVSQVHILEGHMSELQTTVSSLNSQLQASRQESVRWRTLANDRLKSIETLRKQFDDQYHEEITTYRDECEKYKEENLTTKQELSKLRLELSQKNSNVNQVIQEKDTKLHELTMTIMQLKNELKLLSDNENKASPEFVELELSKQLVDNELEAYKKRFEQISAREKSAREEIRNLRGQLIKRPVLSARSDRGDKVKEQLQKKIATLEKELAEVNERLEKETAFNEARRVKITEDFTLWEKQKKWQQAAEKCKEKLNVKNEELEKLQQSYNAAKTIISRLEREKHILEGKLKVAKNSNSSIYTSRLEVLENENSRLKNEVDTLSTKLEMQHYHSGGLGASMLQEKLEAQERKIAILELSAKGTNEVTAELERLNSTVASLKKTNLRLEAENLELGIDLKKVEADTPYLREQIQHLDRYIEALKTERDGHHVVTNAGDQQLPSSNKKMQELEKTILSLKRLVEKLQVENKRLQCRARPCSSTSTDRKFTADKSQMELKKIREQYAESIERSVQLKDELDKSQKKVRFLENAVQVKHRENESSLRAELSDVMAQLVSKSQLLDKVKILLQKAALKEKYLEDQITQLKDMMTKEDDNINLG